MDVSTKWRVEVVLMNAAVSVELDETFLKNHAGCGLSTELGASNDNGTR